MNASAQLRSGALYTTKVALPVDGTCNTLCTGTPVMLLRTLTWSNRFGMVMLLLPNGNVDVFRLYSYELQPVEAQNE